jgi:hypothetical protein
MCCCITACASAYQPWSQLSHSKSASCNTSYVVVYALVDHNSVKLINSGNHIYSRIQPSNTVKYGVSWAVAVYGPNLLRTLMVW